MDVKVATPAESQVESRLLEHDAARASSSQWFGRDVESRQPRRPMRGGDCCCEDADRRRLACAVRAEQAEDLPGRNLEVDALDGLDAACVGLA